MLKMYGNGLHMYVRRFIALFFAKGEDARMLLRFCLIASNSFDRDKGHF